MAFGQAEAVDVQGNWMQGAKRQYTLVLQTESNNPDVDKYNPIGALTAPGVPKIWDAFSVNGAIDARSYCVSKSASRPDKKSWKLWHVTCQFETLNVEQLKRTQHPLLRPAEISDGYNIVTAAKWKDRNGNAIMNKAKQPFDPPIEIEDARPVLTITRNFANRVPTFFYNNRVNSAEFQDADPGKLRAFITQSREVEEYDANGDGNPVQVFFWRATGQFEYREEGWQPSVLNAGLNQLTGGLLKRITEGLVANAPPVADPWPLDNNGAAITAANLPASAVFLDFDVLYEADFNNIGFFA